MEHITKINSLICWIVCLLLIFGMLTGQPIGMYIIDIVFVALLGFVGWIYWDL